MYSKNIIERLREKKKECKFTNAEISKRSGVPLSTVNKILGGLSTYPRQENVEAIANSLGLEMMDYRTESKGTTFFVRETRGSYQLDKKVNTVEDYYNLPEDFRAELIDGEMIKMEAPSVNHQMILNELTFLITQYLREFNSPCKGFPAPFDVQLDKDEYTIVQPDYVIICDKSKYINGKNCYGAPDLAIEILSPSTKEKDCYYKLYKYLSAGVKEFWVIDPMDKNVVVYPLFRGGMPIDYTLDDVVSSLLFDGLTIDFSEIHQMLV